MNNITNKQIINKINKKFYCVVCDQTLPTNANLNTHYKTKKHLDNIKCRGDNYDIIQIKIKDIDEEIIKFIKTLGNSVLSTNININNVLKKNYKIFANTDTIDEIDFVTKTPDESHYVCTGCYKCYELKVNYIKHADTCQQIRTKYKLIKQSHVKTTIQTKQLKDVCTTIIDSNDVLIKKYDKLKNKYEQLKKKYEKLETSIKNQNIDKKIKDALKDFQDSQIKSQIYANTVNNGIVNNNKFEFNIILGETQPFKYVNPFIDPLTKMPHNYNCPQEYAILADNPNATVEIKSSLCNAIAFHESHLQDELVDFVAKCIVHTYRNDDYSKQSFWSTDTTRASYHVRVEGEEKNYWQKDKEGEYLKNHLVNPLISYICEAVNYFKIYNAQKHICKYEVFDYSIPVSPEVATRIKRFLFSIDAT